MPRGHCCVVVPSGLFLGNKRRASASYSSSGTDIVVPVRYGPDDPTGIIEGCRHYLV